MQRLREVSGSQLDLDQVLGSALAGDFDPAEYDAAMAAAFGDDYYDVRLNSWSAASSDSVMHQELHACLLLGPCLKALVLQLQAMSKRGVLVAVLQEAASRGGQTWGRTAKWSCCSPPARAVVLIRPEPLISQPEQHVTCSKLGV